MSGLARCGGSPVDAGMELNGLTTCRRQLGGEEKYLRWNIVVPLARKTILSRRTVCLPSVARPSGLRLTLGLCASTSRRICRCREGSPQVIRLRPRYSHSRAPMSKEKSTVPAVWLEVAAMSREGPPPHRQRSPTILGKGLCCTHSQDGNARGGSLTSESGHLWRRRSSRPIATRVNSAAFNEETFHISVSVRSKQRRRGLRLHASLSSWVTRRTSSIVVTPAQHLAQPS